jgi:hypothetical protein
VKSHCSTVDTATVYMFGDRGLGVEVPVWSTILTSPYCQVRLWGSPSLLSNGYRGLNNQCQAQENVDLYLQSPYVFMAQHDRLCGLSSWLQIQRSGMDSRRYQIFRDVVGLERGPLSLVSTTEELLERKVAASV